MKGYNVVKLTVVFFIFYSCSIHKKSINPNDICFNNLSYKQILDTLVWDRYYRKCDTTDNDIICIGLDYSYIPILEKATKISPNYDEIGFGGSRYHSDSIFNMDIRRWANYVNYNSIILPKPRNSMKIPFIIEE